MKRITEYKIGWNPGKNRGYITVQLEGEDKHRKVTLNSNDEFLGIGLVLQEEPVYVFDNGLIGTGEEPVG